MALTLLFDLLANLYENRWSKAITLCPTYKVRITRAVAGIIGFASIGIAVAASEFDGLLRLGVTAVGLVSGPLLALFVLGLFTTVANKVVRNPSVLPSHRQCDPVDRNQR